MGMMPAAVYWSDKTVIEIDDLYGGLMAEPRIVTRHIESSTAMRIPDGKRNSSKR